MLPPLDVWELESEQPPIYRISPPDDALALSEPLQLSFTVPPEDTSAMAVLAEELVEMMSPLDDAFVLRNS